MSDEARFDDQSGAQLPAKHARDDAKGASGKRGDRGPDDSAINEGAELENPQAALGGADGVQKTSYVVGRTTDPDAATPERDDRTR